MVHNSKIKRISLAVCLALTPLAVHAAGLGRLTVFSGLGEPFNAEIELSATKEELSSLFAKIAPAEAYGEQGLQRPAVLNTIRLELAKQPSGVPVLKLTSVQPVEDPFIDMLVQVEWSNGRLLREYTALLDPPGYGERPAEAQPVVAGAEATPEVRKGAGKRTAATRPATESETPGEEYKTHAGDTLRGIAKQVQVEGVSLEQMLVGLYRANEGAFTQGNMNRLKTGQIIRVPSGEELQGVSQQEAIKEIRIHTSDWNAYRQKLAAAVAESEGAADVAQGQSVSGKITSAAEDKAAPAAAGPRDVVKLSRTETSQKPGAPESTLSKEDAIARDKAAKEADARVVALEKQVQDMQKLLEIKNQNLAELEKSKAVPPQPTSPAPASQPATVVVEAKPVDPQAAQESPAEAKPELAEQPKKPRRKMSAPVPESAQEPDLLQDPVVVSSVGGGLIALLAGAWLYLRSKRRKGLDSFERAILSGSATKTNTVFGSTTGGVVDTGDTSFLTDLTQGTGGMIDTNDVDPIAEAEVYMAYGRDAQAEEILKDAITKDPTRYELQHKLLEIYAGRKDTGAFETLASELYATLGSEDATWVKCAAMGRELEPENPLYQTSDTGVAQASVTSSEPVAGETPMPVQVLTGVEPEGNDVLNATGTPSEAIAGAIPQESVTEEPRPVAAADAGLDFELELPEPALENNAQLDATELGISLEPVSENVALADGMTVEEALPHLALLGAGESTPQVSAAGEIGLESPPLEQQIVIDQAGELPEIMPERTPEVQAVMAEDAGSAVVMDELPEMVFETSQEVMEEPVAADRVADEGFPALDTMALELPSLDLDEMPQQESLDAVASNVAVLPDDVAAEEIVLETLPAEGADLDFNFDAEVEAGNAENPVTAEPAPTVLPDLDLSSISLDLDEAEPVKEPLADAKADEVAIPAAAEPVEEITLAESEQADVDTKLDLVAAYMDMGDTEGARELLEEVLREGGPQQRQRAQSLLDTLS